MVLLKVYKDEKFVSNVSTHNRILRHNIEFEKKREIIHDSSESQQAVLLYFTSLQKRR